MTIQVNQYQQIRVYYEQEHRSVRWIARELHCSRDTVRKYIEGDSVPWDRKPGSGREYSAAPEPGVRRMRATVPMGQSPCSGR